MVVQAFLIALVSALVFMESRVLGQHMIDRPIVIGPLVGLIMGDLNMGLIVGGNLELIWMGLVGIGTTTPPDVVVGSALATAFTISTGASVEEALALALPIALMAQMVQIGVNMVNSGMVHLADRWVAKGDWKGVGRSVWMGASLYFITKFCLIFFGFLVGADVVQGIVDVIPAFVSSGLSKASGLLPALGVAMLMQLTLDKKFAAFLFLGFALSVFMGLSTVAVSVIGAIFAYIYYMFKPKEVEEY